MYIYIYIYVQRARQTHGMIASRSMMFIGARRKLPRPTTAGDAASRQMYLRGTGNRECTGDRYRRSPCRYRVSLVRAQSALALSAPRTLQFERRVESRFGPKRGFGVTPGELLTISKPNPPPKSEKPRARKRFAKPNL